MSEIFGGGGGVDNGDSGDIHEGGNSVVDETYTPPKVTVDTESADCSHYEEDGYYCVPYYQCEDGEIVVDGGAGEAKKDT